MAMYIHLWLPCLPWIAIQLSIQTKSSDIYQSKWWALVNDFQPSQHYYSIHNITQHYKGIFTPRNVLNWRISSYILVTIMIDKQVML